VLEQPLHRVPIGDITRRDVNLRRAGGEIGDGRLRLLGCRATAR
jgi:hypothetical protein